jgi:hypothetical protein
MSQPIFFDIGRPYVGIDSIGFISDVGRPFFSIGAVAPASPRVLYNPTNQAYLVTLGNPTIGYYIAEVPVEKGDKPGAITVPADHITGEVVRFISAGLLLMFTEAVPPSIPTDISLTPGAQKVTLSWTNPSEDDFYGVRVLRKTGSYPSAYNDPLAETVYEMLNAIAGVQTTIEDVGLVDGTTYFYAIFVRDLPMHWSTAVTPGDNAGQAVPADVNPPAVVTDFLTSSGSGSVNLSWTNPNDVRLAQVSVRRKPLTLNSSSGLTNIQFVSGSATVLIPNNLLPSPTPGDRILAPNGKLHQIQSISLVGGTLTMTSVYIGDSISLPSLSWFPPSQFPASHVDGTLVYDNLAPFAGFAVAAVDTVVAGNYLYAVFGKDLTGNWNDNVVQNSNALNGISL